MGDDLAAVALRPGPLAGVIALQQLPDPAALAPGEVRVRMLAAAVNPSDAVTVSGAYASRTTFPLVPGFEGVGVIDEVGPGVAESMRGRRVLPVGSAGCWARSKRTPLSWCVPVPDDLSDDDACFAYVNPLTAWLMVQRFCGPGVRRVLVTAATSTIAGHLAQLLAERGIRPVGLTRGTPGRAVAQPELWHAVIGTGAPGWEGRMREAATGAGPDPAAPPSAGRATAGPPSAGSSSAAGIDVVLDCVGGPQGLALMEQLVPGGTLVHYGLLSGQPLPAGCFDGRAGRRVEMVRLRDAVHARPREELPALFAPVLDRMRAGLLRTSPARRVPLSGLPEALRARGIIGGKILVECER